jgi:hypothetical protein
MHDAAQPHMRSVLAETPMPEPVHLDSRPSEFVAWNPSSKMMMPAS